MAKHRTHSVEFKRQVSQEYLSGDTLHGLLRIPTKSPGHSDFMSPGIPN